MTQQSAPRAQRREAERAEASKPAAPSRVALPANRRGGSPGQFIQDTYNELKKVVWPTRQTTTNLTIVVITVSLVVGILLGGVDWLFTELVRLFLVPPSPSL